MDSATANEWRKALHGEPELTEVMADPTIGAVMASDGVSRAELSRLVANYRDRRPGRPRATKAA